MRHRGPAALPRRGSGVVAGPGVRGGAGHRSGAVAGAGEQVALFRPVPREVLPTQSGGRGTTVILTRSPFLIHRCPQRHRHRLDLLPGVAARPAQLHHPKPYPGSALAGLGHSNVELQLQPGHWELELRPRPGSRRANSARNASIVSASSSCSVARPWAAAESTAALMNPPADGDPGGPLGEDPPRHRGLELEDSRCAGPSGPRGTRQ